MSRNKLVPTSLVSMLFSRADVTMHPLVVLLCELYKGTVDPFARYRATMLVFVVEYKHGRIERFISSACRKVEL